MNAGLPDLWTANLLAAAVPALLLGSSSVGFAAYLGGAGAAGVAMMLVEEPGDARALLHRRDVRAHAAARAALSVVVGSVPYLIGRLAAPL
ncbi:hypothetical protein COC42_08515 [Sphingomonas spermidinifaciens]|uniref:Uncharacterized protein n=1 Tax=Sphingomonas spermidinifaciens TaxID=1141889 RepID=A0A2A4B941_9SPHN|nr:hypothetical protein [Sphingomonas spermidinifaciens]PCD04309.1 hypothetical protein COC42_08515 [Sphingomonas spermidinifaciens]